MKYRYFRAKEPATHSTIWRVDQDFRVESKDAEEEWVHYNCGVTFYGLTNDPLVEEFTP